ncbi:hypothetical protein E3P99_00294 [Wallemia hederae]|uniref:UspA domain-containing protein n=1 Tax=Wallemia hederae TaxID=1540922 RepID=A0A4T0G186_9BASI|nr:hypothetical protein E3P99_00294 [Wallemia hederae]
MSQTASPITSQPSSPSKQIANPMENVQTALDKDEVHQVIGKPAQAGANKILIGWKNSPEGNKALEHYLTKVIKSGDHVILLVVLPTSMFKSSGFGTDDKKMDRQALRDLREHAQQLATEKIKTIESKGATASLEIVHGERRYVIEWLAHRRQVDLIILGRKKAHAPAKGLSKMFLGHPIGSTVQHVLHKVSVPVLVVN